jgi:hypothetical protein
MTLFASFATNTDQLLDGDDIATSGGWMNFAEWAGALADDYPLLAELAEEGTADDLQALEGELEAALADKPGKPSREVLAVGRRLLAVLSDAPQGAVALAVTDGTEPEEGEEEDEEDEDPDNGLDNGDGPEEVEEEDTPGSLRGVQTKGASCGCGPGCSCSPCKSKALEDEGECRRLQKQMLDLDDAIGFIHAALETGEAVGGIQKALSALAEGSGGALVPPAAQGQKDHLNGEFEAGLRQKLVELTERREKLRERLCSLCGICDTEEG